MAFRDDKQAMKLRIAQLESELATANDSIARLKGYADERSSDEMADMLTKEQFHLVREIDREVNDDGLEAIADMLRKRLPTSNVSMVGKTLHCKWMNGTSSLSVVRHEGRTEFRVESHVPQSKWLMALGGMGFAALAGPLVAGLVAGAAGLVGVTLSGAWGLALAPVALIGGYFAMQKLTAHNARTHRIALRGAFEAAMALVEEHAEEREPVRIQVDATSEAELEAATEEAALAEAAAETEALR